MVFPFHLDSVHLGVDEDGDQITTLIVNEDCAGTWSEPEPKAKLSKTEKIALRCLESEMNAAAVVDIVGDDNGERLVVRVEGWRQRFYREGKPGEAQETKRQAFKRAIGSLLEKEQIGTWNDLVWRPEWG